MLVQQARRAITCSLSALGSPSVASSAAFPGRWDCRDTTNPATLSRLFSNAAAASQRLSCGRSLQGTAAGSPVHPIWQVVVQRDYCCHIAGNQPQRVSHSVPQSPFAPSLPQPRPALRPAVTSAAPTPSDTSSDTSRGVDEAEVSPPASVADDEWKLEYEGALSGTVRTLKLVSLTTAALSLVGSPIYIMATMDGQYTAVKVMAAGGFTCFGLFTTGLLHWFIGPYVHRLWHHAPSGQVRAEVLNLFAQKRQLEFHKQDVKAPDSISPLQSFEVNGKVLFVDEATFENKDLLETLTPPSPFDIEQQEQSKAAKESED